MNFHKIFWVPSIALSLAVGLVGCKSNPPADDASLNAQVQSRLSSDQNLSGQSIQASVANGIVTLNGSVTSDSARSIASGDAAQVAGIKTVVNNLVVQAPAPSMASLAPPAAAPVYAQSVPIRPEKGRRPSASIPQYAPPQPPPIVRNAPAPEPSSQQNPPPPAEMRPPPPPAPVVHNITVPAGTSIPVRITQTLDSATTQPGDKFTGAVASDIYLDGMLVLAQGTPVTGHVDAVQDAAHFKGSSLLTISLTSISRRGERFDVATDAYTRQGEGRGKNTAEKVGGGAAVGAILGGIFGGGKGAAIGAAAGGGVGAGAQGITRGQQVQITSETVVRFRLSNAIVVRVTTAPGSNEESGPALERRNNQ